MTTLTSASGPPEVINARRTESLDAPNILKLVQPSTEALFGRVNVVNLIEKAVLAVTLSNERDEVLGHASFFDYPNLPTVDTAAWEEWLGKHYNSSNVSPLNALFLHYFVAKAEYSHGCAQEIVRTLFNAVPELHFCFLVVPTGVFPDTSLANLFQQMDGLSGTAAPDGCTVFVCHRHAHVPVLHVRHARVEDHDDLVPIFNRQSAMLTETYGDYFLAELIEATDENMKCVVAEVDGTAIGFMSISTDVNLDLLNECFELGPYNGLHKTHPDDQLERLNTPIQSPVPAGGSLGSARSDRSGLSQGSKHSLNDSGEEKGDAEKTASNIGSHAGSRISSKHGSVNGDEARVKQRLVSETDGCGLVDNSDAESVKSAASQRRCNEQDGAAAAAKGDVTACETPKLPELLTQPQKRFVPQYQGESSAFCIQLFCIDEKYEMRSLDFLPKAFELFPGYDFCVITVPHLVPEFPLLQQFVRVSPRCPSTLSQELYVFSRPGLIRNFIVRSACTNDYDAVQHLVERLDMHENLLQDLRQFSRARRDDNGTPIQAYVAECGGQVVGVAITRQEEDIEYIRSHYNIEDFIYYNHHRRSEHAHLHHYALNPVFRHYSKHFLKEVLRLGHNTCLYYPLYPGFSENQVLKHSLVAALNDMVPVRARRQIEYPVDNLGENVPSERVLNSKEAYALNHINRKLTLEPKVTINARIVLVGASDTGMAFLDTFAFCPHLRFNNVTVISPHGLPGVLPPDELRNQMLSSSHCYSDEEYAQMALRTWINVVYGKMTAINRHKKHVVVNDSTIVPYDHLILTMGTQYEAPMPTEADIAALATSHEIPNQPTRRYVGMPPKNLFVVNDSYDAAVALYWLENNIMSHEGQILLYGHSMDVFSCVQSLFLLGVDGSRILIVEPPSKSPTTCFNNQIVEAAVLGAMREEGVNILSGYLLAQWNNGKGGDVIESAGFTSNTKPLHLECCVVFAFYHKMVDFEAFKAINDACLVYDGRLVIDANFHTNDVAIRAAGPLTKFQRSYHADQWTNANFNSKEVGIQLASAMLSLFDPTLEPEPEPPTDLLKLIPMYRSPKITSAKLPGGYHYLHVAKPGLNTPLEAMVAQNDYGRELITGTPGGNPEFFRLHVNQYNTVETITCLSKKPFCANNLICLFGLHERFLNNLVSRFDEGLISDFYAYFNETWSMALFHDRFPDFRDEVRELLITRPAGNVAALEEKVRQLIDEDLVLNKTQRANLQDVYRDTNAKRAVETRLLSFLSYNYYHLPIYAKPGMV